MRAPAGNRNIEGHHAAGTPVGAQGTLGGIGASAIGSKPGRQVRAALGDEVYLWILVAAELVAIGWGRKAFRRYHGG